MKTPCPSCGYRCGCCCHCECVTPCPRPNEDGDCLCTGIGSCHGGHPAAECLSWGARYAAAKAIAVAHADPKGNEDG